MLPPPTTTTTAHLANLLGHALHSLGGNADASFAAQRLAAQFEENPGKLGSFGFAHKRWKGAQEITRTF
jgi:hypothetical protein